MKNILLVSAIAWLLTIALAFVSSPSKSAGNEPLECMIQKGGTPDLQQASKSPPCEAHVSSDAAQSAHDPVNVLKR